MCGICDAWTLFSLPMLCVQWYQYFWVVSCYYNNVFVIIIIISCRLQAWKDRIGRRHRANWLVSQTTKHCVCSGSQNMTLFFHYHTMHSFFFQFCFYTPAKNNFTKKKSCITYIVWPDNTLVPFFKCQAKWVWQGQSHDQDLQHGPLKRGIFFCRERGITCPVVTWDGFWPAGSKLIWIPDNIHQFISVRIQITRYMKTSKQAVNKLWSRSGSRLKDEAISSSIPHSPPSFLPYTACNLLDSSGPSWSVHDCTHLQLCTYVLLVVT